MRTLVSVMAVALTCGIVAVSADLFRMAGLSLYTEQYIAGLVAIAMPLLFLSVPARGGRGGRAGPVPWYDVLAAIASFVLAAYVAIRFPTLSEKVATHPWQGLLPAALIVILFMEGLRRTSGPGLFYTTIAFFGLALVGGLLPGEFAAKSIPLDRLTYYVVWDSTATLGVPMKIVSTVVAIYVLFGLVLFSSGGGTFFTDISTALMGRYRGGPAKICILGSSLFGTISGNVVSSVLTVGVVTIPLMKQAGFRPHVAAAIEANASTAGQLDPPVMGIAAFVMAEFLQVSYGSVALAAIIPSVLYYTALFIQVDLEAARSNLRPMDPDKIPRVSAVVKSGWYFVVPFAVLIYALFWLNYEPETAGLLATAVSLALAVVVPFKGARVGPRALYAMLRETGLSVLDLFMIGAASGIMIGALNYSGVGFTLSIVLLHLAGGSLLLLLVLAAIANIILGAGLPTVGVYILLATLVAPSLIQMNIAPMAAHMFILYYGCLSMITPPVAIAAFVAANLAGADPNRTGWTAMAIGWMLFVLPFLFVFRGTLLLQGHPLLILVDFALAVAGVWFVSAAVMGYSVRPLALVDRLAYGATGVLLFFPTDAVVARHWLNLAGVGLAAILLLRERASRSRLVTAPE